jgi:Uri superfamily endonuclease
MVDSHAAVSDHSLVIPQNVHYNGNMKTLAVKISSAPGTYAVCLRLMAFRSIVIGKMGKIDFSAGWYVYVGSAMGPGGLAARIGRHCRVTKKKHWHIDYLRPATRMKGVFVSEDPVRREHEWARCLRTASIAGRPVSGFGSSDCRCVAHLFYFKTRPAPEILTSALKAQWVRSR